jgi:tRNA(Ile)-lysidine synthase
LLVRPLWNATRDEARAACHRAGWTWREDSTNDSPSFVRNRVRHEVLPLMGAIISEDKGLDRLTRQAARSAAVLRDDIDWLDEMTRMHLAALTLRQEPKLLALDGIGFCTLHTAAQRRVLRAATRRIQGHVQDIGMEHIERARRHIIAGGRRAVWQWRGGLHVEWTGAMAGNRIRLWLVGDIDE